MKRFFFFFEMSVATEKFYKSPEHGALFPEIKVIKQPFLSPPAYDSGIQYELFDWMVGEEKVASDNQVLSELLKRRGIIKGPEMAKTCFEYFLAFKADFAVVAKPAYWDASNVLKEKPWHEPSFEFLEDGNDDVDDRPLCAVTLWRRRPLETHNPDFIWLGRSKVPNPKKIPEAQVEHWLEWQHVKVFVLAEISKSYSSISDNVGSVITEEMLDEFETTNDGLEFRKKA